MPVKTKSGRALPDWLVQVIRDLHKWTAWERVVCLVIGINIVAAVACLVDSRLERIQPSAEGRRKLFRRFRDALLLTVAALGGSPAILFFGSSILQHRERQALSMQMTILVTLQVVAVAYLLYKVAPKDL
eukprot:TRINITY_DN47372_c0_g1_i1.p2 TRINITY_DN47372_c0_g1~~TRINITY_DN47372_c0_g1_i1.p2  ORF type:complete len:130 (+),score=26.24 TRINITY_DN47372_c0_g1_i1:86-475(+)